MKPTIPITNAVTWPKDVRMIFEDCVRNPVPENRYGLVNNLMYYCLCQSLPCVIMRRIIDPSELDLTARCKNSAAPIVFFDALDTNARPFIMFQAEDSEWAEKADLRLRADKQMRLGFDFILSHCGTPHFWGLSLLGSSLRVYRVDVATKRIEPPLPSPPPNINEALSGDHLEGAWDIDILSQEGFNKMKEIVQDIATLLPPRPPNW